MNCFATFKIGRHQLHCHRHPGHDGKHQAVLVGTATVHWADEDAKAAA